jgi:hypothetical protein
MYKMQWNLKSTKSIYFEARGNEENIEIFS